MATTSTMLLILAILVASSLPIAVQAVPFASVAPTSADASGTLDASNLGITSIAASDFDAYPIGSILTLLLNNNQLVSLPLVLLAAPSLASLSTLDLSGNALTGNTSVPIDLLIPSLTTVRLGQVSMLPTTFLTRWNATASAVRVILTFAEGSQPAVALHRALVPFPAIPKLTLLTLEVSGSLFAAPAVDDLVATAIKVVDEPTGMQLVTATLPYTSPFLIDPLVLVPFPALQNLIYLAPLDLPTGVVQWDAQMPAVLSPKFLEPCQVLRYLAITLNNYGTISLPTSPVSTLEDQFFARLPSAQSGSLATVNLQAAAFEAYPDRLLQGLTASFMTLNLDGDVLYAFSRSVPIAFFDYCQPSWTLVCDTPTPSGYSQGLLDLLTPTATGRTHYYRSNGAPTTCPAGTHPSYAQHKDLALGSLFPFCSRCAIGSMCPARANGLNPLIVPCPSGQYGSMAGQTSCFSCPHGTWSDKVGATSASMCLPCGSGTASNQTGAGSSDTCVGCAAGSFSVVTGASSCQECPAGTYQSRTGSTQCIACPTNTWLPSVGATSVDSCLACPTSAPNSPAGSTAIEACTSVPVAPCRASPGYITTSNATDASCTVPCPLGHRCVGSAAEACGAGTYADRMASTSCTSCAAGKFSVATGAASEATCVSCPRGSFSSIAGATSCEACPAGTVGTMVGSSSVSQCSVTACSEPGAFCPVASSQALRVANFVTSGFLPALAQGTLDASKARPTVNGAASLRFASTPALDQTGAFTSAAPVATTSVSSGAGSMLPFAAQLALVLAVIILAAIVLAAYRLISPCIARRTDLFSMEHDALIGEAPRKLPTQLGSAWTMIFCLSTILITIFLATSKNERINSGLVLPTAFAESGSATSNIEWVLHAHADEATVAFTCLNHNWVVATIGFNAPVSVQQTHKGAVCEIAITCYACNVLGHASVSVDAPWQYQSIEHQLYTTGATTGSFSRYYGIVAPQPRSLLPAETTLSFALIESFYIDTLRGSNTHQTSVPSFSNTSSADSVQWTPAQMTMAGVGSGYESSFVSYTTSSGTSTQSATILPTSTSRVSLALDVASTVQVTILEQQQSALQIVSGIISIVVSSLAIFVLLFKASAWLIRKFGLKLGNVLEPTKTSPMPSYAPSAPPSPPSKAFEAEQNC
jgi:hypothetical protein